MWGRRQRVDLEYELRGTGEPVVLIRWGVGAAWAEPLPDQPALASRYLLLSDPAP
jgi:hypothetical protein